MPTIIKKGTNSSAFRLRSGKVVNIKVERGGGDFLNFVTEEDFKALMNEYGSFIAPRIISESNPKGCFIISATEEYAKDMANEIADEIQDNSALVEIESPVKPEPIEEVEVHVTLEEPEIADEIQDNYEDDPLADENLKPELSDGKSKKGKK